MDINLFFIVAMAGMLLEENKIVSLILMFTGFLFLDNFYKFKG